LIADDLKFLEALKLHDTEDGAQIASSVSNAAPNTQKTQKAKKAAKVGVNKELKVVQKKQEIERMKGCKQVDQSLLLKGTSQPNVSPPMRQSECPQDFALKNML
jgi:hypothetical protein